MKRLITLKMFGATFGIRGKWPPWLRPCSQSHRSGWHSGSSIKNCRLV